MCFDSTQKQASNSTQSGTSNTQGNIWPQIQPFVSNFLQEANSANVQPNQYQLAAGDQQTGVAGALAPAQNVALNVSQQGLSPSDITPFMSPYIQSVVDPTVQNYQTLLQGATSDINGSLAKNGALGNSNNSATRANTLAPILNQAQGNIASLYNTGYGQAANLAAQSKGIQLQGAQTAGGLSNAATGANSVLGNIGQGVAGTELSNALIPTQYATAISPLSAAAGSNTTSTGTSNQYGTTTQIPSTGGVIAGLLGAGLSAYAPKASGGAVERKADGGPIGMMPFHHSDDMVTKVGKAFGALHKMRKLAEGGGIEDKDDDAGKQAYDDAMKQANKVWPPTTIPPPAPRPMAPRHFDEGGDVGLGSWAPTVTPSSFMDGFNVGNFGKGLTSLGDGINAKPGQAGSDPLTPFMHDMEMRNQSFGRQGYDDGGSVDTPSWGSRFMRGIEGFLPSSVGRGIEAIQGPVMRGLQDYPEAAGEGLGYAANAASVIPGLTAPVSAVRALNAIGEMAPMPRHTDKYGPPVPAAAPAAPVDNEDGAAPIPMTGLDSFYGGASANNEPSSIASAKEVLPWKLGASDRSPPDVTASLAPPAHGSGSSWKDYLPFQSGVWKGDQMSPTQRLGFALTQVGADNPFKGYGQFGMSLDKARLEQAQNAREQQLQPSTVKLLAAKAKEASQAADLDYQIKSATAMGDLKRVQELQRMKSMMGLATDNGIDPTQAMVFDRVWNPPNRSGSQ